MSGERFYKLLGLTPEASEEEIKASYKHLAKIYHPDKNPSPKAGEKFQQIQEAYTYVLQQVRKKTNEKVELHEGNNDEETTVEEWTAYRQKARNRYRAKKQKQEKDLDNWYIKLRTGWNRKLFISIVVLSCSINLLFFVDFLLPKKIELDRVTRFSEVMYKSMDNHRVSVVETENGRELWLNHFNNAYFLKHPFAQIKTTAIFRHPIEILVESDYRIYHVPVHFNFYWAQLLIQSILLIPLIFLFYKKNDAYFIMGHHASVYLVGGIIIYFLLTENRLLHMITMGYY